MSSDCYSFNLYCLLSVTSFFWVLAVSAVSSVWMSWNIPLLAKSSNYSLVYSLILCCMSFRADMITSIDSSLRSEFSMAFFTRVVLLTLLTASERAAISCFTIKTKKTLFRNFKRGYLLYLTVSSVVTTICPICFIFPSPTSSLYSYSVAWRLYSLRLPAALFSSPATIFECMS